MEGMKFLEFNTESLNHFNAAIQSYAEFVWKNFYQLLMICCHFCRDQVTLVQGLAGSLFEHGYETFLEVMNELADWMIMLNGYIEEVFPSVWSLRPAHWFTITCVAGYCILVGLTIYILKTASKEKKKKVKNISLLKQTIEKEESTTGDKNATPGGLGIFDLAKTAYQPGHAEAVIKLMKKLKLDVNKPLPNNGLTLFLCACISGERQLVDFMLKKAGAVVTRSTKAGDSPLYLATFGILSSETEQFGLLQDLIEAGCDVNAQNSTGYTCLHRAASKGNIPLIKFLLKHGADPYLCNNVGIYPVDSAISGSHLHAADLLVINLRKENVGDMGDPHTPDKVDLTVLSPHRKLLMESSKSRRRISLRK